MMTQQDWIKIEEAIKTGTLRELLTKMLDNEYEMGKQAVLDDPGYYDLFANERD